MKPPERGRGFTLLELLVVIALVAVGISFFLPLMEHTHCGASRVQCGSNLRQIGQAFLLYANENKGEYPRIKHVPDAPPVWGTGIAAADPFSNSPDAPAPNDVSAALFLLIRTQDIASEVFVCPTSHTEKDTFGGGKNATAMSRANFTDWRVNMAYGVANPYPDGRLTNLSIAEGRYVWNSTLGAEFVVAGDISPGVGEGFDVTAVTVDSTGAQMQHANSQNHQGAGQNLLFGDGHVDFVTSPFAGTKRDNVYTVSGAVDGSEATSKTVVGPPKWSGDTVLLPPYR